MMQALYCVAPGRLAWQTVAAPRITSPQQVIRTIGEPRAVRATSVALASAANDAWTTSR